MWLDNGRSLVCYWSLRKYYGATAAIVGLLRLRWEWRLAGAEWWGGNENREQISSSRQIILSPSISRQNWRHIWIWTFLEFKTGNQYDLQRHLKFKFDSFSNQNEKPVQATEDPVKFKRIWIWAFLTGWMDPSVRRAERQARDDRRCDKYGEWRCWCWCRRGRDDDHWP